MKAFIIKSRNYKLAKKKRPKLLNIIIPMICAVIHVTEGLESIEQFVKNKMDRLSE